MVKALGFVSTLAGADEIVTNSYHHQSLKKLGVGFEACAVSCDGIIEAAEHTSLRYYKAVQWHPEFSYMTDENSRKILRHFAESCKK